jgi:hypothetical protein
MPLSSAANRIRRAIEVPESEQIAAFLAEQLAQRLSEPQRSWWQRHRDELRRGEIEPDRFASLLSLASRFAPREPLAPTHAALERFTALVPGWSPERWSCLEALRVCLLLARPDLVEAGLELGLEECFRYADEGEQCALYRALPLLPGGGRFTWRAGEGCRSNMRSVFEAVACDSPYPALHFDDLAWRQLVIKAVFIAAPLWRVHGLDERLSPELARMALDLAEERRSAGRPVQPELWLCIGVHGGERASESLEQELEFGHDAGRQAAALGLARAGASERLKELARETQDADLAATAERGLRGECDQAAYASLHEQ